MASKDRKKRQKTGRPLDEVDGHIIMLMLSEPGISQREIAERIKYKPGTVGERVARPEFQAEITKRTEALTQETIQIIKRAQRKAADRVVRLMDSTDEQVAARVSLKVLDGIPEVAAGTLKQNDPEKAMTEDERRALAKYMAESEAEEAED